MLRHVTVQFSSFCLKQSLEFSLFCRFSKCSIVVSFSLFVRRTRRKEICYDFSAILMEETRLPEIKIIRHNHHHHHWHSSPFGPRPSSEASASCPYSLQRSSSFSPSTFWHHPSRRRFVGRRILDRPAIASLDFSTILFSGAGYSPQYSGVLI